jgi:hypothetical protein
MVARQSKDARACTLLLFDQSRTVSWASAVPFHPRMAKMSGREVLEAVQAGLLAPPPLARAIGFHIRASSM